jgi:hypothetical protein
VRGTAQRRQDPKERRLAGAVRHDDGHKLAGPDIQIDEINYKAKRAKLKDKLVKLLEEE